MYWIPAVLLFYIPSGIVVVHLSGEMPLEGGLYQWAKLRFGEMVGFLVALNLWATTILLVAGLVSMLTDSFAYAAGPSGAWIVENKLITAAVSAFLMGGLALLAIRGLSIAKWLHNLGGFVLILLLVLMILFALPRWIHGTAVSAPVAISFPAVTLLNLNIAAKMGFGAFCGFEACCVFSGELRNRDIARTLRRSIFIAGPIIALIYIVGTACALAFTLPANLDLISPIMQALTRGAHGTPLAFMIGPVVATLMIVSILAGASICFNAVIRLPMVAGWDRLLPAWLSRLHPRFKTPVGSILCVSIATFCLTLCRKFWSRRTRSISIPQQHLHYLLGTHLPCHVQHPAHSPWRETTRHGPHSRSLWVRDDAALRRLFRLPHRRRQKLSILHRESHHPDSRNQLRRSMVFPPHSKAKRNHRSHRERRLAILRRPSAINQVNVGGPFKPSVGLSGKSQTTRVTHSFDQGNVVMGRPR